MSRKLLFLIAIVVTSTLMASAPYACDRGDRGCRGKRTCLTQNPWGDPVVAGVYDESWGYPRSLDVCNYDAECYPWISGNGKYLLFSSINFNGPPRPGHQGTENWDIYISEWDSIHQRWGEERNAGPVVNTLAHERRPSCTPNCDTLYFDRDDDIYMSTRDGSDWTTPVVLPPPVNTMFEERHPAISPDRKRLYFTSDRPDGHGGRDIWVAKWDGSSWSSVENMGPVINTPNEETRPFESYDGQRFYFSNNHGQPRPGISYGGSCDIYVSTWTDSGWGSVYLVVAPINCDLPACSPCESSDGNEIWFGSEAWEGSRGDEDIWVAIKGVSPPPSVTHGYGNWVNTDELTNAIYVYDLKESADGIIYAATACAETEPMGKVFRTSDGGITWTACADLPGAMVVYSLIVDGDTLYAGTYPYGDVFKSINKGNSWVNTADLPAITSARCLVRLHNGDILVGTSPYDVTNRNRIYRTTNGGSSWILTAVLPHINPCKFLYQTTTGAIYTGGFGIDSETMIHKSVDNGATWDSLVVIPQMECHSDADGFYETTDGILYVAGYVPSHGVREGAGFVYKSMNQGISWEPCSKIVRGDGVNSGRIYSIVEDTYGTLYVGMQPAADSVVFLSPDGGQTWHSAGGLDGAFECLCLLRAADGSIYAGTTPNGDVFRYVPQTKVAETHPAAPTAYRLTQNYPNPFNASTTIRFQVPRREPVKVEVYDILGRQVRRLLDANLEAGQHDVRFDGRDGDGRKLSTGVYLYRMAAGDFVQTRKMVFLK